jgi:hypothetical protein
MKKQFAAGLTLFISMLFSSGNLYAFDEAAKKLFDNGQYDECIQRLKSAPDKKQRGNVMLLAYSNYQLYNFTKQKNFNKEFESLYDALLEKTEVEDLKSILFFVNSSDKPAVVESARDIVKEVFGNLHRIDDIVKILPFANSSDKKTREYAFDAIQRIMEPIRDVVTKGGTMRPIDLVYFQNKDVIKAAAANADIKAARETLVLIEEPALEFVKNSDDANLKAVADDISDTISDRKKEYPNSSWYSATGKQLRASR